MLINTVFRKKRFRNFYEILFYNKIYIYYSSFILNSICRLKQAIVPQYNNQFIVKIKLFLFNKL